MRIYLIRHGQKQNKRITLNPNKIGLTEKGRKQAETFAQYAKRLDIKKIYVSPYLRTKETAESIEKELNIKAEETEIIAEIGILKYLSLLNKDFDQIKVNNFEKVFLHDLRSLGEEDQNVLLITHSGYLRMLKTILSRTNDLKEKISLLFSPMHNLALTTLDIETNEIRIIDYDKVDFLPKTLRNKLPY